MRYLLVSLILLSMESFARTAIEVVGSSTVYPFSTVVAERFGRVTDFETPKIESTGSGGGMKLFCSGIGTNTPDVTNASRKIKLSEIEKCKSNGVSEVYEVLIGYDGIVFANSKESDIVEFTRKDIFLALAKEIPSPSGLVTNPYTYWNEVNPSLPATRIEVLGPPPTSGTRDAFVELAMEGGCKKFPEIAALKKTNKAEYKRICHTIREDGAFVEAGENDNLIVQKISKNPNAFGIFGYSFLDQNTDKVQGSIVEGAAPEFELIATKEYPISRPLYFYVKAAHIGIVPGILEFVKEFTSERAWGEEGYLAEKGLIPRPLLERSSFKLSGISN